jgi:hypothetical protein
MHSACLFQIVSQRDEMIINMLPELINFNELNDWEKQERIEKIIIVISDAGFLRTYHVRSIFKII